MTAYSVLILARNEAENLQTLLPRVRASFSGSAGALEIIVVDADSPDGTADVAARQGAQVIQQSRAGYANALRQGFALCEGDYVITLDADFSHRPDALGGLLDAIGNADIVIASRYVAGGRADMPASRRVLSVVVNRVFGWTLGLRTRDLSSGFRVYRRSALQRLSPRGEYFDVLPEIVALAHFAGLRVAEVPFHYRNREAGVSKARVLKFAPAYVRTLLRCRREKLRDPERERTAALPYERDQIE
ncbi:MAG TPA: glycosyltransferase [Rudaea sp.]